MTSLRARRYDNGQPVELEVDDGRVVGQRDIDEDDLPWLLPSFVDLQLNGWGGKSFTAADVTVEDVARVAETQLAFGVTRFCPTVTTQSQERLVHAFRTLASACEQDARLARRMPAFHLEGPYISPDDGPRGAHAKGHVRPPDWDEFQRFQEAAGGRIRIHTLSPEYENAADFIARSVGSGVTISIGHTKADTDQIRAAVDAGATLSTHLGNGAHGQIRRHPNYIWDQLAEDRLTATLIVDGHHLPPAVVKTMVRAKGPERCILVSDAAGLAGMPPGRYGGVEILEDGRLVVAGQRQFLAGAGRPLSVGVGNVMAFAGVSLPTAASMSSSQPATVLGIESGGVEVGAQADLVLCEVDGGQGRLEVVETLEKGETVWRRP